MESLIHTTEKIYIRINGVLVAKAVIDYPQAIDGTRDNRDGCVPTEAFGAFNAFYREVARRCGKFADEILKVLAKEEYEADTDEKKHFRYKPLLYSLGFDASDDGDTHTVTLKATLRGGKYDIAESSVQCWTKEGNAILPFKRKRPAKQA